MKHKPDEYMGQRVDQDSRTQKIPPTDLVCSSLRFQDGAAQSFLCIELADCGSKQGALKALVW